MARSPAHRFGQIIGEVLEAGILPMLERFAREHDLYLDKQGSRPCRRGKKCSWLDLNGNSHDLDYVLERGGTPDIAGMPAAFIETAWRRYTKHSRNKVQEIQGAIEPLAETYRNAGPFKGAILAGVFTEGALVQLRSLGFTVLYFPYDRVIEVFRSFGVDADFDESTSDHSFRQKVRTFERLSADTRTQLGAALVEAHADAVREFESALSVAVLRQIERILVLVLHGSRQEVVTIRAAIEFIQGYSDQNAGLPIERYEIEIRYNNGDTVRASFRDQVSAVAFLMTYEPVAPKVK